jgi:hypothetical protein
VLWCRLLVEARLLQSGVWFRLWCIGTDVRLRDGMVGLNLGLTRSCELSLRIARLGGTDLWFVDWGWSFFRVSYCAIGDKGTRGGDDGGATSVLREELLTILGCLTLVLELGGHGWRSRAAHGCQFGWLRTDGNAASASVVGDAVVIVVDDDGPVIDVGNVVDVNAIHGGVVVEAVSIPVAAVIAIAGVSEAVVDASIEANVRAPEAVVEAVAVTEEEPVARGPEGSGVGGGDPRSGDPIIAGWGVTPIAGSPEVIGGGGWRLIVGREWRRGLIGLQCCLTSVNLVLIGLVAIVVGRALRGRLCGLGLSLFRLGFSLGVLFGALLALVLEALTEDSRRGRLDRSGGSLPGLIGIDRSEIRVRGVCV